MYKVIGKLGQLGISGHYDSIEGCSARAVVVGDGYLPINRYYINMVELGIDKDTYGELLKTPIDIIGDLESFVKETSNEIKGDDKHILQVMVQYIKDKVLDISSLPITLFDLKYELNNFPMTDQIIDCPRILSLLTRFIKGTDALVVAYIISIREDPRLDIMKVFLRDISPTILEVLEAIIDLDNKEITKNVEIMALSEVEQVNAVLYYTLNSHSMTLDNAVVLTDGYGNISFISGWEHENGSIHYNEVLVKDESYPHPITNLRAEFQKIKIDSQIAITEAANSYATVSFDRSVLVRAIRNVCEDTIFGYCGINTFIQRATKIYGLVMRRASDEDLMKEYRTAMKESDETDREYLRLLMGQRYTRTSLWHLLFKDMEISTEEKFLIYVLMFLGNDDDLERVVKSLEIIEAGELEHLRLKIIKFIGESHD